MDTTTTFFGGFLVALLVLFLIALLTTRPARKQEPMLEEVDRDIDQTLCGCEDSEFQEFIQNRLHSLEDKIEQLYRHQGLVYRKVPTHGEVVTISSLGAGLVGSSLAKGAPVTLSHTKSTKERSA